MPESLMPAFVPQRVLVTGAGGAIGRRVARALIERGHKVRGFDRAPAPALAFESYRQADLTDRHAVADAVEAAECIVHLAATPDDADFLRDLLPANVVGLFHVMDAARDRQARRVVLASSVQVVVGLKWKERQVRIEDGIAPRNHYALTKVWAETMGSFYAAAYNLTVIAARIGWYPRTRSDVEGSQQRRAARGEAHKKHPVFLSHHDAGRFFVRCVEAPATGCHVLYAMSRDSNFDMAPAKALLGYEPQDTYPDGLEFGPDGRSV